MTAKRLILLSFMCGTAVPKPAVAQDAAEAASAEVPENAEASEKARAHFQLGMQHYAARKWREAMQEFELAAQLIPSADLWYNIARAHEELNEFESAVEYYRRYLRDRVDPPDREQVEAHIQSLEERIEAERKARLARPDHGFLNIRAPNLGSLKIDGRALTIAERAQSTASAPGVHRVEWRQTGYLPVRVQPTVRQGITTSVYVERTPSTQYRAIAGKRIWTWVAAALSVAAVGTAVGLGVKSRHDRDHGDRDSAGNYATYSDYTLGAGLGLGLVSAVLFFIEGRAIATERVSPTALPRQTRVPHP